MKQCLKNVHTIRARSLTKVSQHFSSTVRLVTRINRNGNGAVMVLMLKARNLGQLDHILGDDKSTTHGQ